MRRLPRSELSLRIFHLAPMSTGILVLTLILLLVPVAMLGYAVLACMAFIGPSLFVVLVYAWVWLLFRPTGFVIHPDALEVVWPMKRRRVSRSSIQTVRLIDRDALKREIDWGIRIGAGGLWGGFGWLWTRRRGIVQMYISRPKELVWIERGNECPWLITPERPEEFVRLLSAENHGFMSPGS